MDLQKVDKIIQYALAVAAEEDDFKDRELGPIHLIKYVYLADLAYAEKHGGETFTGTDWTFYHFGPWALPVYTRLDHACSSVGASKRVFASPYRDDNTRWSLYGSNIKPRLQKDLPFVICMSLDRLIHTYGKDTSELLHYVYRTTPMLKAAPNEILDFTPASRGDSGSDRVQTEEHVQTAPLSIKQQKRRTEILRETKRLFQERMALKQKEKAAQPPKNKYPFGPPRYDEVYQKGMEWLDTLAGPEIPETKGELTFAPNVWKSTSRFDPELA